MLRRNHFRKLHDTLDPVADAGRISVDLSVHEFPWDIQQALSLALFRTFAVPSIGGLLADTGEFTGRVQKRYDDTGLLLGAVGEHGLASREGRAAVRRINQMHAAYDISQDDLRYVLATFVVTPVRWLLEFGYRPLTAIEVEAATNYYRELGRMMGIRDVPADYRAFEELLDDYERAHFGYDEGGRRVADSTLDLFSTFLPVRLLPRRLARRQALALMDDHLLEAFRYPRPTEFERSLVRATLRARAAVIRRLPGRSKPKWARDISSIRGYRDGYEIENLGTFPVGATCPRHAAS